MKKFGEKNTEVATIKELKSGNAPETVKVEKAKRDALPQGAKTRLKTATEEKSETSLDVMLRRSRTTTTIPGTAMWNTNRSSSRLK